MIKTKRAAFFLVFKYWGIAFFLTVGIGWWFRAALLAFQCEVKGFLFSGFLTLGSFLLTTKVFIITRLQEGLFASDHYGETYDLAVQQHGEAKIGSKNEPLRRLTEFLVWSVFSCMMTALLQLALGAAKNEFLSLLALAFASGSLALVIYAWFNIRLFIHQYLEIADRPKLKTADTEVCRYPKIKPTSENGPR